jgi:hypothetical protein
MMRLPVTREEIEIKNAVDLYSGDDLLRALYGIIGAATESAYDEGYDEGYNVGSDNIAGKIEKGVKDVVDGLFKNLKQGLDLIDTDRSAAKVYLDRATRTLGRHLIEVSPCLL